MNKPTIIPRNQHCISRADISENALKVLYRLKNEGFAAYLVGGSVRDLLLRRAPKDFDIATNAHPEQIKKIFRNCRLIGRRFRLAHIIFGRDIIELATFRRKSDDDKSGMLLPDNLYGNIEEDAFRRDFTVNALFYNIADFSVVDYTNGMQDLQDKKMRIIGDGSQRYKEDPVRMLRAIRFAAKLEFEIANDTATPIKKHHNLLEHVSPARLFDEIVKLFFTGHSENVFKKLMEYNLAQELFPFTTECLAENSFDTQSLINITLKNTDERVQTGKPTTPAFLIAAFLWHPLQKQIQVYQSKGFKLHPALEKAMEEVIHKQIKLLTIPRRFTSAVKEIWALQYRLPHRTPKRSFRLLSHRRFRAAYDFLLIRAEIGEEDTELADWWTDFQIASDADKDEMLQKLQKRKRK